MVKQRMVGSLIGEELLARNRKSEGLEVIAEKDVVEAGLAGHHGLAPLPVAPIALAPFEDETLPAEDDILAEAGETACDRFLVDEADHGERLDRYLVKVTAQASLSRTRLKNLIDEGAVQVEGVAVSAATKLRMGQTVTILLPELVDPVPKPEKMPLKVVFEDAHLLIVDKPAGLVVHPAAGHPSGTLVNALLAHCGDSLSGIGGVRRPGIVHRLDKDTSGLLVVAKSDAAHRGLAKLFADHGRELSLERSYLALVWGAPERPSGTVEAALGRHPTDRQKMAIVPEARGRFAITHWEVLESFSVPGRPVPIASLVACHLETGRTHQIRVHMAHLGHPVLGDPLYSRHFKTKESLLGKKARAMLEKFGRQALHASVLGFEHPITKEEIFRESPLPKTFELLRAALEKGL